MSLSRTPRIALHTLGCKLNQAETATIGRQFVREGYTVVPFGDPADVVVLNTCSVTERADRECRQLVRRARRVSPGAFVAVVGCYAQLRPEEIASLQGVDLVAGTEEKFDLVRHVRAGRPATHPTVLRRDASRMTEARSATSLGADRTRAFLKVQDGCDYTCSFCTIPLARGESRSVPREVVLEEARTLAGHGYKEVVLTGVNTGDYGRREGSSLLSLLSDLVQIDGFERIRISSVEPNLLSDDLLDFWISHPKLCDHWHMPLQSGSPAVLRSMRRRYSRDWYADRVRRIHAARPLAGIGADVIVGAPGESGADFEETLAFVKELPFSYLHVFAYSARPWTDAAQQPGHVDPRLRAERSERLRALGERKKRSFNEQFIGSVVTVLVEGRDEEGFLTGLSEEYLRVRLTDGTAGPNDLLRVSVTRATAEGCDGIPLNTTTHSKEVHHAVVS